MLKQFVVWLVTKFLTKRETFNLVIDRWFVENPRNAIDMLYHLGYSNKRDKDFPSFLNVAACKLAEDPLNESLLVITLLRLKLKLVTCAAGDCRESEIKDFFYQVNVAKDHQSALKVRKDLVTLIRARTIFTDEGDIALTAAVLQNVYIDPASATKFITTTGE